MKQWLLDHGYDAFVVREAPAGPREPCSDGPEQVEDRQRQTYDEAWARRREVAEGVRAVAREADGRIARKDCRHIQDWLYEYLKTEVNPYDFNFAIKD